MLTAILVDDEYYALEGLRMDLELLGTVQVLATFEDGKDALEHVATLKPDLIFLDIDLPGMNGLMLFDALLETYPQARIVFVTAYNQYAISAFELNAMDYILKPVRLERLQKTIQRFIPNPQRLVEGVVQVECFGGLTIRVDGEERKIPWRTKKAEELFAYLACAKGQFVSKEKLAAILWSELDGEKSMANFYLAYHYLKKQSDQSGVVLPIESARGKIRLNTAQVQLDFEVFEADVAALEHITEENLLRAEKTMVHYKGILLDGHYYEWSVEAGWHYEILYRELAEKIADYYEKQGNQKKESYYRMRAAQ